ncbi:hypothetical protein [Streptomyces sp. NPDC004042]|uniref:hypothetical protein n=1 Tax=Streptomyces sp. NPDC004042 TaxID=3154451 RepID=UPI0033B12643
MTQLGLWIGLPGALREITDGASAFDRSPDLGVTEFRSLAGGVTTWAPPVRPRRLKLTWDSMQQDDVQHLDRLARRLDQLGPVALVDPLARNLLGGAQAAGLGPSEGKWSVTGTEIILYGGGVTEVTPNVVSVETVPASGHTDLVWRHPYFHGYPVAPGQTYTWWTPGLDAAGAPMLPARVSWYDASTVFLSESAASTSGRPAVVTAPPRAAYVRPYVAFTAKGMWGMGESVLALGDVSAALLAGDRPIGDGTPPYSITRYSHVASEGDGAYRDISLELVEVTP